MNKALDTVLPQMTQAITKAQQNTADALEYADAVAEKLVEIPYDPALVPYDDYPLLKPITIGIWTPTVLESYKALSPDERQKLWISGKPLQDYLDIKQYFEELPAEIAKQLNDLAISLGLKEPPKPKKQTSILPLLLLTATAGFLIYKANK